MQQRAPGAQPGPWLRTLGSRAQLRAFSGSGLSVGHASGPPVLPPESRPFSTSAPLPHVVLDHRPPCRPPPSREPVSQLWAGPVSTRPVGIFVWSASVTLTPVCPR